MSADRFFIIGAQRSATTALYDILDAHPTVVMAKPRRPEPKFFLRPDSTKPGAVLAYEAEHFAPGGPGTSYGEKSTAYIETPAAAARIAAVYPTARVVAVLREPVQRAVSNYAFSVQNGLETRPMRVALDPWSPLPAPPAEVATSPFDYLGRSRYAEHLRPWFEQFPAGQLHVSLCEELVGEGNELTCLADFLGIDPAGLGRLAVVNESPRPEPLPVDLEAELRHYFEPFNADLEMLLGRPLTPWRAGP